MVPHKQQKHQERSEDSVIQVGENKAIKRGLTNGKVGGKKECVNPQGGEMWGVDQRGEITKNSPSYFIKIKKDEEEKGRV